MAKTRTERKNSLSRSSNYTARMALRFADRFQKKSIFLCLLVFLYGASANVDTVKEKTLAMVKPDGVDGKYVDVIKKSIFDSGFSIIHEIELQLEENTVKTFYAEHSSKSFFSSLVQYMTSGPVLIMVLEKENAIDDWRAMIGPTDANRAKATHPRSIRALCGIDSQRNCVHGSDSPQSAAREISFFFNKSSSVYRASGVGETKMYIQHKKRKDQLANSGSMPSQTTSKGNSGAALTRKGKVVQVEEVLEDISESEEKSTNKNLYSSSDKEAEGYASFSDKELLYWGG